MSSTTRYPLAVRVERFDIRRDSLDLGLVRRVHAGRGEVFGLAMHQQNQRPSAIGLAEIEFERVQLGEAVEGQQLEVAEVLVRGKRRHQIVSVLVARPLRAVARLGFESRGTAGTADCWRRYSLGNTSNAAG